MKMRALKPVYFSGTVQTEGSLFETQELHGRELIKKGYAEQAGEDTPAEQPEQPEQPEQTAVEKKRTGKK